ncbi:alpha/beta hydrolase family protein [Teredinibacter haidensis]|uniref:alpha/beta hydrolase family protein n=1 Tax=Teredinibacter haidensis TaxID=2731755 RepID=UPI000948B3D7|nr:acetylxylan esterase [Teredinibacter haidensis]
MKTPLLVITAFIALASQLTLAAEKPAISAEQDHQQMLKQLGITSIRRGADGNPSSPHAANYDESKANGNMLSLPPLLSMANGDPVASAQQWWQQRRPELLELFDKEIYGLTPKQLPSVEWQITHTEESEIAGIKTITENISGRVDNSDYPALEVAIKLSITRPKQTKQAVPLILQHSFDPALMARFTKNFSEQQLKEFRGGDPTWQEQIIRKGWAYAELISTSVQADNGAGLRQGIIGLKNKGQARKRGDWGTIKAWSWAAGEALNYIETRKSIDANKVAIAGHSRFGKTALVTMAYDQRFAAAFISSSGEGGAKLWRRNFGEQIGNIAGSGEYHWVAGNFIRYAGPLTVTDLPVDAHHLIALCAPRPVFISSGTEGDQWVDPKGMYLAAELTRPLYQLLGKKPLSGTDYPKVGKGLLEGDIAWRQHNGGHTPGPNWKYFLQFLDRSF